jgi:hypothetical protein
MCRKWSEHPVKAQESGNTLARRGRLWYDGKTDVLGETLRHYRLPVLKSHTGLPHPKHQPYSY